MSWQKKLRYRGFRLLGFSLPILLLSLVAASFIPRRPPQTLATGDVSGPKKSSGRLIVPAVSGGEIPLTLMLQWDRKPPSTLRVELQISDPEGQDHIQKRIKIKAKSGPEGWQQTLAFLVPPGALRSFTLTSASREPVVTRYSFIAFAGTPAQRLLRIGEMLFYPALAIVLLALVMIIFPSFVQS